MPIRLPDDTQRLAVVGRTGSGKSVNGIYHLSQRSWDLMPWIIIDFKRDKQIAQLPAIEMELTDPLPNEAGIYVIHPLPDQKDELEDFFWRVWDHENIGIFVDEAYMIGQHNKGYRAILTQGRSKHIPVITLSQRPVAVDTFTFSEADYVQIYALSTLRDRKTIQENTPLTVDQLEEGLPEFHSFYYDVKSNQVHKVQAVPQMPQILRIFNTRIMAAQKRDEPVATNLNPLYRL